VLRSNKLVPQSRFRLYLTGRQRAVHNTDLPNRMSAAQRKQNRPHAAARRGPMPAFVEPMRPSLASKPFSDPAYLFELKLDGWRAFCFLRDRKAHLVSRRRNSLNERFPELRDIGELITAKTALIDGEVVALDQDGLPRFDALRSRRRNCLVVFYAFDLLHLDGYDLTSCPLIKRKTLLKHILPKDNTGRIRFTDHVLGNGEAFFQKVEALNLEGMVMKRKDSVYSEFQSRAWLKVRTNAGKTTIEKRIENWG
jgi:bifunctional non-homologous end joining protein LigD